MLLRCELGVIIAWDMAFGHNVDAACLSLTIILQELNLVLFSARNHSCHVLCNHNITCILPTLVICAAFAA